MRRILLPLAIMVISLLISCGTSQNNKDEARSSFTLGQSYLSSGNTQQAFIKFHEALKYDPNNKEVYHALGYINMRLGEYAEAEKNVLKAVDIDSGYSEAWNTLCTLYHMYMEKYDDAAKACETALENNLYPTPEKSLYNLGRIYYKQRQYRKSLAYTEKAIKRLPSWFPAYYSQALTYNALGQYPEAVQAVETAIGLDPRFQGDKQKAEKHFKQNRLKKELFETSREADQLLEILHY